MCPVGLTSCVDASGGAYCVDTATSPSDCGGCGIVTPGAPRAELCNGLDDDCNGVVDKGSP